MSLPRYFKYILFSGILVFFMLSCSREEPFTEPKAYEEAQKDSVETNSIDTPAIFIQEKIFLDESDVHYSKTDTVLTGNDVFISTPKDYESYKWLVGNEPDFRSSRKFRIWFKNPVRVKVRLFATDEKGETDTFSRYLTSLKYPLTVMNNKVPLIDTFKGYNKSNPSHKFKAYFALRKFEGAYDSTMMFYNLPEGCKDGKFGVENFHLGYKAFVYGSSMIGCRNVYGWGYLTENRQGMKVEYEVVDSNRENWIDKVFIGKKVK